MLINRSEERERSYDPGQRALLRTTTRRVFIFTLLVFCISPVSVLSDGQYSLVLSDSILRHHSVYLNSYRFPNPVAQDAPCGTPTEKASHIDNEYQLDRIGTHVVYCYPNGSSILSIPFVALMSLVHIRPAFPDNRYNYTGETILQRLLAAILMAALTCLVYRTSLLFLDRTISLVVTVGTAFGTQVWSTASRTLWSHTWFILIGSWAVYIMLRSERDTSGQQPVLLATLLSWMYFVRPTGILPIACIAIYMLVNHRGQFAFFAATGIAWAAIFMSFSWFILGTPIPPYYVGNFHNHWSQVPIALAGTLISPSRGLFVFVPSAAFVLYLVARYWQSLRCKGLVVVALSTILLQVLFFGTWRYWWGGYSYGPRLMTDLVPWFALLGIVGLAARAAAPPGRSHKLEAVVGLFLLGISVLMNGRGAISWATFRWNNTVNIDFHPERAFDWSYPQFMAGLISAAPKYQTTSTQELGNSKRE